MVLEWYAESHFQIDLRLTLLLSTVINECDNEVMSALWYNNFQVGKCSYLKHWRPNPNSSIFFKSGGEKRVMLGDLWVTDGSRFKRQEN